VQTIAKRPVPQKYIVCALCVAIAVVGHMLTSGKSAAKGMCTSSASGAASPDAAFASAVREAYQQGYDDGVAGVEPRPPKHIPTPNFGMASNSSPPRSSSGLGFSSLMKYGMAGYYVYNTGKTPVGGWDPNLAVANVKQNPLQAIMLLVMVSGILF